MQSLLNCKEAIRQEIERSILEKENDIQAISENKHELKNHRIQHNSFSALMLTLTNVPSLLLFNLLLTTRTNTL